MSIIMQTLPPRFDRGVLSHAIKGLGLLSFFLSVACEKMCLILAAERE